MNANPTIETRVKGPRIRYEAKAGAPFETITVEKLTPIIGADNAGYRTVLTGPGAALLVPAGDGRALAERIAQLLGDADAQLRNNPACGAAAQPVAMHALPRMGIAHGSTQGAYGSLDVSRRAQLGRASVAAGRS